MRASDRNRAKREGYADGIAGETGCPFSSPALADVWDRAWERGHVADTKAPAWRYVRGGHRWSSGTISADEARSLLAAVGGGKMGKV